MRKSFTIILICLGFLAVGQENNLERIVNEVNSIESDNALLVTESDWVELTGITTDGGGILKVWRNEKQICKVVQEVGLSYGRVKTVIFFSKGLPIKIIETEENFGYKNDELDYGKLNEVFQATIYIYDWENDESKIEIIGKRVMSKGGCTNVDYEPIIERAKKSISE